MKESGENYLETILVLENKMGNVRSIDIANELGYTKPSISRAMSILKQEEYITIEQNGHIRLTEKGRGEANRIYERHKLITKYLIMTLGVDEQVATEDACRIEHVISEETFDRMKKFIGEQK